MISSPLVPKLELGNEGKIINRKMIEEKRSSNDIFGSYPDFEPKIVAYVCNWCTYAGADLAGISRMHYDPNVRIIKLPCTGAIDPMFLIKAFEKDADGILVSGCHPGDCHYTSGNYHARRRWTVFSKLLEFCGIDDERVHFSWISASEGKKWVALINEITDKVKALGPFEDYKRLI